MRFALVLLGIVAVLGSDQTALEPNDDKTRQPIMVANLSGKEAAPADAAQKVKTAAPAGLDHKYSIDKIVGSIKAQEDTIAELGKRLEDTLKQKVKLQVTKNLLASIVSLRKAERVLKRIDDAIGKHKGAIKKHGEQADDIADSIKRSEVEHRRELADLNKKLDDIRGALGESEKRLTSLAARRGRVVSIVKKWKEYVATLRDAHQAYTASTATSRRGGRVPSELDLQAPPPASQVLSELGLPPVRRDAALRGSGYSHLDKALEKGGISSLDAAFSALARKAGLDVSAAAPAAPAAAPAALPPVAGATRFSDSEMDIESEEAALEAELTEGAAGEDAAPSRVSEASEGEAAAAAAADAE